MRNLFRYFNSSPEVIRLTVMMYIRYPLSLRQVEDLLFERAIDICHETVRFWWNRFGPMFAAEIRKRRIHHCFYSNLRWHLDEVLEVFLTKRRDRRAAIKFLKPAMKRYGQPRVIVTDRLRSYRAAMNVIGNGADQECGRWLNNRSKTHTSLSNDGRERWQNSGRRRPCRNSLPSMLRSTTTSTSTVNSRVATTSSSKTAPLLWPSGGSLQPEPAVS
jgi:transposase-like protein